MIDFKKKLQLHTERKQKAEKDVTLVVTGAAQLMFNIADEVRPPSKFNIPCQSEMIVCQCCGHTWTSSEADTIKKAWNQPLIPQGLGPLCDLCWHLYSVTNQAHVQGRSLKEVVQKFLEGRAKQTHRPFNHIWTEKR